MKKRHLLVGVICLITQFITAQVTIDGEFRPRTEFRNGFGSLIADADEPGFSINNRIRLNAGFETDAYTFYLSLQDVFTWGENRQINPVDANNSFAIFEGWASLKLGSGFSTKLGRQSLSYDDQRILGGLDWAQQGRNHDLALIQFEKDKFIADFGLAFNQDFDANSADIGGFSNVGNEYVEDPNFFSYKAMQFLYLNQGWEKFSGSLLLMNNTFQNFSGTPAAKVYDGQGVSSLQTLGTHLNYKSGSFGVAANAFLQTGNRINEVAVKGAYLLGFDVDYKVAAKISINAGIEIISGNDADAGETGAFFPLYGTNHKFNGLMDYFYVGNHANSIGLFDVHLGAKFILNDTSNLSLNILNFSGEQELTSGEKSLGTEIDIVYSKKFKGYGLAIGYSHMFASDGMYELKGITEEDAAGTQNWAWAMLTIKPKFLNTAK
tara:strand:- start:1207 stop:2514 length:1308 start_codon:yes stop_codon:yes gene_type:complete